MPVAVGFATPALLADHFLKHGGDLRIATQAEYLARALAFLNANLAMNPAIMEGVKASNGDTVRFHRGTNELAIMSPAGTIKTYYRPIPARRARRGTDPSKTHKYSSDLKYFKKIIGRRR